MIRKKIYAKHFNKTCTRLNNVRDINSRRGTGKSTLVKNILSIFEHFECVA